MRIMRSLIVSFFILISGILFGQVQPTRKEIDREFNTLNSLHTRDISSIEPRCIELYYKSKEISYYRGQQEALVRLLAYGLNDKRDIDTIEPYLQEILKNALKKEDYFYYCKGLALQAGLLEKLGLYKEAKATLEEGITHFNKIDNKDLRSSIECYYDSRYIQLYTLLKKQDLVELYAQKLFKKAEILSNSDPQKNSYLVIASRVLADINIQQKRFEKANFYIKIQENLVPTLKNAFDVGMYHKTKAKYLLESTDSENLDIDLAILHLKRAEDNLILTKDSIFIHDLYLELSQSYQLKQDDISEKYYLDRSRLFKTEFPVLLNDVNSLVPHFDQESIIEEEESFSYSAITGKITGVILFFILLFLFLWFYRKPKLFKNTLRESSDSTFVKNEFPSHYITNEKMTQLTSLAFSDNSTFIIDFLAEFPTFRDELSKINPSIKVSDIEFCALLRLNLDVKQIAEIKKMSVQAVIAKKSRIKKKLNVISTEELYELLKFL